MFICCFSILFWTAEQKKLIDSLEEKRNLCLLGDYGSGKTLVIQAVAEKLRNTDKKLLYINALDQSNSRQDEYYKTWEDVLDVIVKLRFSSGIKVLDMGTMRRKFPVKDKLKSLFKDRKKVSTHQLIDDYIGNLNDAENTVVSFTCYTVCVLYKCPHFFLTLYHCTPKMRCTLK